MSSGLNELLRRRQEIAAQVAELNRELEEVDRQLFGRFEVIVEAFEGSHTQAAIARARAPFTGAGAWPFGEERPRASAPFGSAAPAQSKRRGSKLIPYVVEVLKRAGRPLRTNEILTGLTEMEVIVPGKKPINNLSAHLSHSAEVIQTPDRRWALAKPELGLGELQSTQTLDALKTNASE